MMYDFLIVGAGIFGCVCARELTDMGYKCMIIDQRNHIGGNCYTEKIDGITVHKYGGHIFHTNSEMAWNYLRKFCNVNNYINRVKVNYKDKIYSFPINLFTLHQLWGVISPQDAEKKIEEARCKKIDNPNNLEDWVLSKVGKEIYDIFFYGYTKKQWNKDPKDLPIDIIQRIPIRLNFDDAYFNRIYQGIPINGYSELFEKLTLGSAVRLNVHWHNIRNKIKMYKNIIYTGSIDEFFDYKFGKLEYRSLVFKEEKIDIPDFQGNAVVNYTDENIPYTRILEHKHFENSNQNYTIITKEYPSNIGDNFYPINDIKNEKIYKLYSEYSRQFKNIFFGGRLGAYKYINIDEAMLDAIAVTKNFKDKKNEIRN